ncbi:MAG: hypothetical protein Q9160_000880 [Pyrenula sp. 1 TL-2023]
MRVSAILTIAGLSAIVSSATIPSRTLKWTRQAANSTTCDLSTATASPPLTTSPSNSNSSSCNLSQVQQPAAPTALPAPDGLNLVLIALGQGTQNYTCSNATATPASIGAVASLKDASCEVAGGASEDQLGSMTEDEAAIGAHFFVDATTPDFDVDSLGNTLLTKQAASNAPTNTNGDVPWLMLETKAGAGSTSQVKRIYRLQTKGGAAPASCEGQTAGSTMTVSYEAEYWLYT